MILPDVLRPGLLAVFCGTAPSKVSAARKAYYANPGNRFYRTLYEVGLTDRQLLPEEYAALTGYGLGLTDINKTEIGNDDVLSQAAFDARRVKAVIARYQPRFFAFTSKRAAAEFFALQSTASLAYGEQAVRYDDTRLWVLPSTSGQAASHWKIGPWQLLAEAIRSLADAPDWHCTKKTDEA